MDNLQEVAAAYYMASTQAVKDSARDFFNALDNDGDGAVEIAEFWQFMSSVGFGFISTRNTFNKLDADGNGTLDFLEVMTLYYILKSGRPICDACKELVTGVFFTCVACYGTPVTHDLCATCYKNGMSSHNHDGRKQFLDNYSMLHVTRLSSLKAGSGNQNQITSQTQPSMSTSRGISLGSVETAFKYFQAAVELVGNCTIM